MSKGVWLALLNVRRLISYSVVADKRLDGAGFRVKQQMHLWRQCARVHRSKSSAAHDSSRVLPTRNRTSIARKLLLLAVAASFACAPRAGAESPAPLTTVRAILALTNAEAGKALPVAFEATVTYFRDYEATLFVQDEGAAIYVMATGNPALKPGDRILIKGTTQPSFRTIVASNNIAVLRHGPLPAPVQASYRALIRGELDCRLVDVHGTVRSATIALSSARHVTQSTWRRMAETSA